MSSISCSAGRNRGSGREFLVDHAGKGRRRRQLAQQHRPFDHFLEIVLRRERIGNDARRSERIGRCQFQMPAAVGPAGLRGEQKSGKRIRAHQRTLARRRARVAQRREIELDVGPVEAGPRADEAAGLVHAQRQRAAPGREVAQARPQLAVPGTQLVVERGHARTIQVVDAEVILQMLPDVRIVQQHGQAERAEMRGGPDARQLEQLRRVDGAGAHDHLARGTGRAGGAAADILDARRAGSVEQYASGVRAGFARAGCRRFIAGRR